MKNKICSVCYLPKPLSMYSWSRPNTLRAKCKDCQSKVQDIWVRNNKFKVDGYRQNTYSNLREEIYKHYGNHCQCCGEDEIKFLCIDHLNGNGNHHRKTIKRKAGLPFYWWLKKNDYPKGFQILCHNCNMAKGFYGKCPHKI